MSELAAHLVDRVLPVVPIRQWVFTVPVPVRYRPDPRSITPTIRRCRPPLSADPAGAGADSDLSDRPTPLPGWPTARYPLGTAAEAPRGRRREWG